MDDNGFPSHCHGKKLYFTSGGLVRAFGPGMTCPSIHLYSNYTHSQHAGTLQMGCNQFIWYANSQLRGYYKNSHMSRFPPNLGKGG